MDILDAAIRGSIAMVLIYFAWITIRGVFRALSKLRHLPRAAGSAAATAARAAKNVRDEFAEGWKNKQQ